MRASRGSETITHRQVTHQVVPGMIGLVRDRMSADETEHLVRLLYRYAETELDQWDNWRLDTRIGPVYVSMSMELLPDWSDLAFDPVPKPGTRWQTGRFAEVSGVEQVASRKDAHACPSRAGCPAPAWPCPMAD
jgi:hypothetical protein